MNPPERSETPLLNSTGDDDPDLPFRDERGDMVQHSSPSLRDRPDPLYLRVIYAISSMVSLAGLTCSLWSYFIILSAPFDDYGNRSQRERYEKYPLEMQSIIFLHLFNVCWSGLNFFLAIHGRGYTLVFMLNYIYDFLVWALFIAFGVLNMVEILIDRNLCDGMQLNEKCEQAAFKLLVVELIAINMGLLIALLHFILLITRCCNAKYMLRSLHLRERIEEEEGVLVVLTQRREQLLKENEKLEQRRNAGSGELLLITSPHPGGNGVATSAQGDSEDLISVAEDDPNHSKSLLVLS